MPPLHTDIQPGRGLRGTRLGIRWAWLRCFSVAVRIVEELLVQP